MSHITSGREIQSQRIVRLDGVCDHLACEVPDRRDEPLVGVVGAGESVAMDLAGEDLFDLVGEAPAEGGGKLDGWLRVETILGRCSQVCLRK